MSSDPVYANYYSVTGLFERLRADAGRYPDTMDQRYGAWAQLLTLFRLVHDGGRHGRLPLPPGEATCSIPTATRSSKGAAWNRARQPDEKLQRPARLRRRRLPRAAATC